MLVLIFKNSGYFQGCDNYRKTVNEVVVVVVEASLKGISASLKGISEHFYGTVYLHIRQYILE